MPKLDGTVPSPPHPPPPLPPPFPPPLPSWRRDAVGFDAGSDCSPAALAWPGQKVKCDNAKSQSVRLRELEEKLTQYEVCVCVCVHVNRVRGFS